MSNSLTAELEHKDFKTLEVEAHRDFERIEEEARRKSEQIGRDASATIERMMQEITAKSARQALEVAQFKRTFGESDDIELARAHGTLALAEAHERREAVPPQLGSELKTLVLGVLDKEEQDAQNYLNLVSDVEPPLKSVAAFSPDAAAADFGTVEPEQLAKLVDQANQLVRTLPPAMQRWMQGLTRPVRNQLLHQVVNDGQVGAIARICVGLRAEPPTSLPDPAQEKDCLELLRYAARDRGQDVSRPGDRKLQTEMTALCRHINQARAFLEGVRRQAASAEGAARKTVLQISNNIEVFLTQMYSQAASQCGLSDYSLLAVGSLGRGEVFPYSDLDYSLVAIDAAEGKLDEVERYLNWLLGAMGEGQLDAIGKGEPEAVAERHMKTDRDVLLDARVILRVGEKGEQAADEYLEAIAEYVEDAPARMAAMLNTLAIEKEKFDPVNSVYISKAAKDVKKGLLRLPTFTIRTLIAFYGLGNAPKDLEGRCDALVGAGLIGGNFARDVKKVVEFATRLRLKLHNYYKAENETFYLPADAAQAPHATPAPYVLSASEVAEFEAAQRINIDIYQRVDRLTQARYLNAKELLQGATLSAPRMEKGFRYTDVSNMAPLPGKIATMKEFLMDDAVIARYFTIDGIEYTAKAVEGEIRATRGQTPLFRQSDLKPFL
jgi:hypothetical protein